MKMRKLVAVLTAVLMLCCIIPFSAAAAGSSVTIDFTDIANRTSYSTSQQVWKQNGIIVTNDKGASTSNVGDYGGNGYPARFYKSSTVTIEYPGMTAIVIDCTDLESKYVNGWADSVSDANATASVNGSIVTIVFAKAVDSFTWETLTAQSRAYNITVYSDEVGTTPVDPKPDVPVDPEPDVPVDPKPDAPVEPSSSATITFDDLANRLSCTTEQQVWSMNGITVINDKGASTSNVNEKYFAPVRFYKNSDVTVEYPGMTKIVFYCNTAAYATALADAIGVAAEGQLVTVELDGVDSYTCSMTVAQVRVDSITVYSGEAGETPDVPVNPEPDVPVDPSQDPEADTELSIADAIALGLSKAHNTYTEGKYFVTGVITEVYNTQYGNMYITDEAGNTLLIYGTYSEDGSTRYDAMENAPVAGDTVTIYGLIGQYNGNAQIKNGWIIGVSGGETPDVPVDPEPDVPSDSDWGVVTNPVPGVAYKLGLNQTSKGAIYYFTGAMSGFYGATEIDVALAVDMYVEVYDCLYKLYFIDANGAKKYIKLEQSGTHYNFTFGAEGSLFELNPELNAFCAPAGDQLCYMGTYGTYVTIGALTAEKLKDSDYIARLYAEGETPDVPVDPEPDVPVDPPVSDEIETDYPFLFGMTQYNVSEEDVYFLAGGMNGYYMATTTDPDAAIVVYVEATNGGYYFYTYDGNQKLYINMVVSGTYVNGAYETAASTVYRYDSEYGTLIANVNGSDYWFGTRNDKNYTTMGPCKVEYEGFYGEFYYFSEDGEDPDYPDDPDYPVNPDDLIDVTIPYLFGMVQSNVSEEDIYFLAGGMNGYYMATTTDENAAILVYLEKTEGGYYLYTYDGNQKLYINMVVSGTHVNGAYQTTASTVYTYDLDYWTLVAEVNGTLYAFGTRNDNTYTTMGPVKVEYDGFHADLYYVEDACEHVYDDEYDADCNVCGAWRDVPEKPIETDSDFAASQVEGVAGSTVQVTVSAINNPGIVSTKVKVYFDNTVLKFVSVEAGNFSAGGYSWSDAAIAQEKGYIIINWCDAINADSTADLLATLNFEIMEGAAEGFYAITLEFSCEDDVFNAADETVWFNAVDGGVTVVTQSVVAGDSNGDGKVNNRDLGALQRFLNGYDIEVDEIASDLTGDGKLNNRDLAKLQQLLNNIPV